MKLPTFREIAARRIADALPRHRTINVKVAINTARMMVDHETDERHSLRVALMAADATLALCAGKVPAYVEDRRKETLAIVRKALAETDGNWIAKVFQPLPENEASLLREYGV